MGSAACAPDDIERALTAIVERHITEISASTRKAVSQAASAAIDDLAHTPAHGDITGAYRKGWAKKVEGNNVTGYRATVHQKAQPTLTHLIEFGHGGPAPAPPHPHIEAAYEAGARRLMGEVGS